MLTGLSSSEAAIRLAADGPNALPEGGNRSLGRIIGEVLREPMLALLLGGGAIYLLLGDTYEALILLALATFSIVVTIVQQARTEQVLEALRDLASPHALVIRDGARIRVAGRDIVRGDLLVLEQGDRIVADALVLDAQDIQADESLLTGESVPVRKIAWPDDNAQPQIPPGGEDQPFVYSGSMMTRGSGIARVVATGTASQIGRIGVSLATLDTEPPRLRIEITRIVTFCAIGGGLVALLVVLLYGLLRGGWIEALLAGIAIGMALLPEEFPVVLTIFMAMGAWRIAQAGVLTRRATAIETLGSARILCTDKTGTLTENRMTVSAYWLPTGLSAAHDDTGAPAAAFHGLIDAAVLASASMPVDPMEIAFHAAGQLLPSQMVDDRPADLAHTHGLRPDLLAMSNVWRTGGDTAAHLVAAKGAPEAIARLCRLADSDRHRLDEAAQAMADRGMRVLGVATARSAQPAYDGSQHDYIFTLAGLIGLADPVRPGVQSAVRECRRAGIRVVMITGDYPATARSIATQAGLADGHILTGGDMDALDDTALCDRLRDVTVCARIMPEQKLRIVQALKATGQVVAMTGDGVNDAPSLKAANIGIAMGKRGTDVAREASAIVLLDDDFGSIVKAIRLGRRIYDNIRKAMGFIFAVHVPIAGLALLPLLTGMPLLFGPIHIALLEMIIDPVCALVFEAEDGENDTMTRPPRDPAERLFDLHMIGWSVLQGGLAFGALAALFLGASAYGVPEADVRALTFLALVVAILALILVNRSRGTSLVAAFRRTNMPLAYVVTAIGAVMMAILLIPELRALLKFGALGAADIALVAGGGVGFLMVIELIKPWLQRHKPGSSNVV